MKFPRRSTSASGPDGNGTQLTITSRVGAKISTLRSRHWFPRRFEEPTEAKVDAMDVDDNYGAAPMQVKPRPAENHLQPMSATPSSAQPKDALEDDEHPWWYMTAR